jgi:hypothetical protein
VVKSGGEVGSDVEQVHTVLSETFIWWYHGLSRPRAIKMLFTISTIFGIEDAFSSTTTRNRTEGTSCQRSSLPSLQWWIRIHWPENRLAKSSSPSRAKAIRG